MRFRSSLRTRQFDPEHAFKLGLWTGYKGEKAAVGARGRKRQVRAFTNYAEPPEP
jgi:hypothetical protein